MHRNLSERVEAAVPIVERRLRARLWEILEVCLADRRNAWQMQPDGSYVQLHPDPDRSRLGGNARDDDAARARPARTLRGSHTMSDCVARRTRRRAAASSVGPIVMTIGPTCVLASHSPIAPGSTNVIM